MLDALLRRALHLIACLLASHAVALSSSPHTAARRHHRCLSPLPPLLPLLPLTPLIAATTMAVDAVAAVTAVTGVAVVAAAAAVDAGTC